MSHMAYNREKKLAKNTIIILLSKFCTQFLSFFILPILTAVLSTDEYGTFDIISTYSWLLAPFLSIQLENGIFRYLIETRKNDKDSKTVISCGIFATIIQFSILSVLLLLINYIFNIKNIFAIYIVSVSSLILNFPLQISRGFGDNITYAIASIITGVTNVIICVITVWFFKFGLNGMIIATVVSNILGGMYAFFRKKIYRFISIKNIKKNDTINLIKYSAPLVPNSISSWITSISDKILISFFINNSATGIYSISAKFSILLSHLYSVFNLSWTESASINSKAEDKEQFFSNMINTIFKICACICIIVLAAMPIIFKIMINENYSESYIYIPYLILGSIFEIFSGLLGAIYISFKLSKKIALSTLVAGGINIVINILFLKRFGIIIACISTIISYLFLTIYRYIDLKKYLKIKIDIKYIAILLIIYILCLYLYQYKSILISIILTSIIVCWSIYTNKTIFLAVVSRLKKIIIGEKYAKENI